MHIYRACDCSRVHRAKQLSNTSPVMYGTAVPSTEMPTAISDTPPSSRTITWQLLPVSAKSGSSSGEVDRAYSSSLSKLTLVAFFVKSTSLKWAPYSLLSFFLTVVPNASSSSGTG